MTENPQIETPLTSHKSEKGCMSPGGFFSERQDSWL